MPLIRRFFSNPASPYIQTISQNTREHTGTRRSSTRSVGSGGIRHCTRSVQRHRHAIKHNTHHMSFLCPSQHIDQHQHHILHFFHTHTHTHTNTHTQNMMHKYKAKELHPQTCSRFEDVCTMYISFETCVVICLNHHSQFLQAGSIHIGRQGAVGPPFSCCAGQDSVDNMRCSPQAPQRLATHLLFQNLTSLAMTKMTKISQPQVS
mmetsp:Transcript_27277/g.59636  ORF Transcript_27277/g.59636 Transcript_27277/m.59636 type:complete len:206 (-) Transcript_27277:80-697(-)